MEAAGVAGAEGAGPPPARTSPSSNGLPVRLVGRNRIEDGWLHTVLTLVSLLFPPLLIWTLCKARSARGSWAEVFFQLFSVGPPSTVEDRHVGATVLTTTTSAPRGFLRFVCISDTHMRHASLPPLPAGDVLVHCGDFTNHGSLGEVESFAAWFVAQPHRVKVVVPGNHDMILDREYYDEFWGDWSRVKESHEAARRALADRGIRLLVDESLDIDGVRVHGSPWVTNYAKWRTAFNKDPAKMAEHWRTLPQGIAVLLTHMPPFGAGDMEPNGKPTGCPYLAQRVKDLEPRFHVFGHVHADRGVFDSTSSSTVSVNASCVCDFYRVGTRAAIAFDVHTGEGVAGER